MAGTARKNDPALWERVKSEVTAGDKGGHPGQWSARKAQLAVAEYKKAGGTYAGSKQADNHLSQWTEEDWGTRSGKPSGKTDERYLPAKARKALSREEYDRSTAAKRRDSAAGKQFSRQPADVAAKAGKARRAKDGSGNSPAGDARKRSTTTRKDDGGTDAWSSFCTMVNMPAKALREWLETEDSRGVGWTHDGEDEAVGHQSGRRIVALLDRGEAPTDAEDEAFVNKVVGYIRRHSAQRPDGDVTATRWRYSLMNWGHDPLRGTAAAKPKRRAAAPARKRPVAGAANRTGKAAKPRSAGTAAKRKTGVATPRRTAGSTTKAASTTASKRPTAKRATGGTTTRATAKRASGTTAKRASGTTTKRASGATTKRATAATTKRSTGTTPKRAAAKPAKRPAATPRHGNGATPKRGSAAGAGRGAAGRTPAAAKSGRSRGTTARRT